MPDAIYDLAIIGGGINGAGIAADAAGRGLSVVLLEKGDLGSATSSASSKLIHGGLRYLERFEFRLVAEALREREVLLAKAPHIVAPLRFVLPHVRGMRPSPLIRTGLCLYDHLAGRTRIPGSRTLDLRRDPAGAALSPDLTRGYAYWDCQVDDARLVVLNARAAADRGARIEVRTRLTGASRDGAEWRLACTSEKGPYEIRARALVNAAGPWAADVMRLAAGNARAVAAPRLRLVKGSHIVVPRIAGAEDAYLLQHEDGRVVFVIPFEERFSLVGTTEVAHDGEPGAVAMDADEAAYLLAIAARFMRRPPVKEDIVWSFAGIRPLYDDGTTKASAVSRDYRLELSGTEGEPPLLNVLGGKITTYRRLAEAALSKLGGRFPGMPPAWTADAPLPGGDVGERGIDGFAMDLMRRRPGLPPRLLSRLVRRYGTLADAVLGDAKGLGDLGADCGAGLFEREVLYLKDHEWARTPEDILWRRTKTGLHLMADARSTASGRIARFL